MTKSTRDNLVFLIVLGGLYAAYIGMTLAGFSTYDVAGGVLVSGALGALVVSAFTIGIPPRKDLSQPKLREVGFALGLLGISVVTVLHTRAPLIGTLLGPVMALSGFMIIVSWPFRLARSRSPE